MKRVNFSEISGDYKVIFFDAYGVLNGAEGVLPGVEASIGRLNEANRYFLVVSNDSSNLVQGIADKYIAADGKAFIQTNQIVSSGLIMEHYLKAKYKNAKVVYLGEEKSTGYFQSQFDVRHVSKVDENFVPDVFAILGCGGADWRPTLDKAVNYLRKFPAVELLAPNPDILYFAGAGEVGIAAGSLALMLGACLNRPFQYFGKPHNAIYDHAFRVAQKKFPDLKPSDVLMVGDNLYTDIKGASSLGYDSLLVLSGNTTEAELAEHCDDAGCRPTFLATNI